MAQTKIRYLPALDGLRALAVAGVICYHGGLAWAGGGFLGVDAFFVLSGYLITTLLLREWYSSSTGTERNPVGRIDLKAFWGRRARRLLPAMLLVLGAVAVYAVIIAAPDELRTIRADGISSLFYVANWRFIFSGQSYFAQFGAPSPLKHFWSLAIEEQFYLLWPLLVFGILRWRRGSLRALATFAAALAAGSAVLMYVLYQPGQDPSRVYYGTDTRASSLLVGALLAMLMLKRPVVERRPARLALHTGGIVAALVLGYWWSIATEHSDWLYRGGFVVAALLVALVVASITQPEPGPLGRLLSLAPLRFVGRISYGLYLWHWPVFIALSDASPRRLRALCGPRRGHVRDLDPLVLRHRDADPAWCAPTAAAAASAAHPGDRGGGPRGDRLTTAGAPAAPVEVSTQPRSRPRRSRRRRRAPPRRPTCS